MELMGIINLNEPEEYLGELTRERPFAAVPFAGRYRLIDFTLSNMVNSGITSVGIFVQHNYRSLMDHLRSGKEWDLARKRGGLFILPPAYSRFPLQVHRGDVNNFHANLDYISKSAPKYVLISGANMITNLDYREALAFHQSQGADITILYAEMMQPKEDCLQTHILVMDDEGVVSNMVEYDGEAEPQKMSLGMFIMEKRVLVELINSCISQGDYDFIKHCIIKNCDKLKIYGYCHQGYVAPIVSLQSYFRHTMNLLKPEVWKELFFKSGLIYTKVKDEPPSKYTDNAQVVNSLVAGGCHIEGKVENSILFRGVKVHPGASIKNSIVMQKGEIGPQVSLENVICDKDVHITIGKHLKGEGSYPLVIKKGWVI